MSTWNRGPLRALVCIVLAFALPARAADRVTLTVAYFENTSGTPALEPLKKGLAEMLITDLAVSDELAIVERARLNAVLEELALQGTSFVDPATAVKLGKGLGASYVLVGSYLVQGENLRVDTRLVDVSTSQVVVAAKQEGPTTDFLRIEQGLVTQLLEGVGAKLTLLQAKRVGARSTNDYGAFEAYARGLDAADAGRAVEAARAAAAALEADPNFQAAGELQERVKVLAEAFDVQAQNARIARVARYRKAKTCACARAPEPADLPEILRLQTPLGETPGITAWPAALLGAPSKAAADMAYLGFVDEARAELDAFEHALTTAGSVPKLQTRLHVIGAACYRGDASACSEVFTALLSRSDGALRADAAFLPFLGISEWYKFGPVLDERVYTKDRATLQALVDRLTRLGVAGTEALRTALEGAEKRRVAWKALDPEREPSMLPEAYEEEMERLEALDFLVPSRDHATTTPVPTTEGEHPAVAAWRETLSRRAEALVVAHRGGALKWAGMTATVLVGSPYAPSRRDARMRAVIAVAETQGWGDTDVVARLRRTLERPANPRARATDADALMIPLAAATGYLRWELHQVGSWVELSAGAPDRAMEYQIKASGQASSGVTQSILAVEGLPQHADTLRARIERVANDPAVAREEAMLRAARASARESMLEAVRAQEGALTCEDVCPWNDPTRCAAF